MNETTAKLLEQLATKLGTTSAYLWSVLLKQAPIDATINLVQLIALIIFGFVLFLIHKRLSKQVQGMSAYEDYEEFATAPMVMISGIWFLCTVGCLLDSSDIITGYLNPEYWALNHILDTLKK